MKDKILNITKLANFDIFVDGAIFLLGGFLLSFAKISGVFSPFCLAFCISLGRNRSWFAFCGGILGVIVNLSSDSLVYFFALIIGFILKFIFEWGSSFANAVCTMISLAIPKLVAMILMPASFSTWVIDYCEVIFCSAITVLFSRVLKKKFIKATVEFYDFVGLFFVAISILISLCNFELFGLNFGRLFAIFAILESIIFMGVGVVSIVGISTIIGLILYTKSFATFAIVATISGFLTGSFINLNKIFKIIVFNVIYFLSSIFWGGMQVSSLIEVLIVSVVVSLISLKRIEEIFIKNKIESLKTKFKLNDELSFKLKFTARTLLDLQTSIEQCAKNLDSINHKDMKDVYGQVAHDVCRTCGLNTFCWITSYNDIMRCLNDLTQILRENGKATSENIPVFLKHKCCRLENFINSVNFEYKGFMCREQTSRRVNEAREVAAEQFTGMAELLIEMSQEILDVEKIDNKSSIIVSQIFKEELIEFEGLFCFLDKYDRLTIDIYLNSLPAKNELKKIANMISLELDKEIEYPSVTRARTSYKLSFFEAATLKIDFAAKQTSPNGNTCCGDSYDYFMDGKGFAHLLLSDGMGNGKRAAIDSLMTCFTMRKLIETGFGFNSTLKLLNLSFSIKSKEESLATIDTCTIDLYSGYVKFVKAGATASYISNGGEICEFTSKSLPIGIIQGVSFDCKEFTLKKGDVIVMVSDGATASGFDWIAIELKRMLELPAKKIATNLLNSAKRRSDPRHKDDITVMVAKIK